MKYVSSVLLLLGTSLALAGEKTEAPAIGSKVAFIKLRDYRGAERSLDDFASQKAIVLTFISCECPISKQYAPRLAKMAKEFESKGIAFVGIDANQQDSPSDIARYAKDSGIAFPVLKDVNNVFADQLGVKRTTEVIVLDAERVIRYRGRVDDQYHIGIMRNKPTRNDLRDALEELLAGKPVSHPSEPALGCFIGRVHKPATQGAITYSRHIARILNSRCVECHRPGEIGPFSLTSYEDAVGWAETIDEVVQQGRMPPWHADPKYGHFSNESRLNDEEKKQIADWVSAGSPQGDPKDLPPAPTFAEGWRIPKPDVVLTIARKFKVPATGTIPYQFFAVETGFTEDKWIRAAEVKPSCRAVVHHVLVFVQPPDTPPSPGQAEFVSDWLAASVPGARPMILRDGLAKRVPAGSRLLFQIHYTTNGGEQVDQTSIGLTFADPNTVHKEVHTDLVINDQLRIPPNDPHFKVEADRVLSEDSEIWTWMPHTHVRGTGFRFDATYPDGKNEILLDVPTYDFNWQNSYVLAEPKVLPKGTRLHCTAYYNNSKSNLANPNPNKTVLWGEQTWEEMMIGYFDRTTLREDRLKNPPAAARPPQQTKALPALAPELSKLANSALSSQKDFNAFAKAVHDKLPQVDRLCVTSVTSENLRVVYSAYPGKKIFHLAETGFEQKGELFTLTAFALFNQFAAPADLGEFSKGPMAGMDIKLLSSLLKSSVHVPVILESLPSTFNVWSSTPKAFSPDDQQLVKALAAAIARKK